MEQNTNEMVDLVINLVNGSDISSIKQVVTEILNVIQDENSSAKDLKEIIERAPPLCSKLLRLANSALYGYSKSIGDIQEAIVCIGFDAVRELALNQKVCELFMKEEAIDGYSRWSLWEHSSAVGVCSKMIYRREFGQRGDNIYVAGLLHDLGIIVEDQFFQEMFRQSLKKFMSEKVNLYQAESELISINHTEIAWAIAVDWEFPDELIQAIGCHHEPEKADPEFERIVRSVYLANFLCQREKIGFVDAPIRSTALYRDSLAKLGIKDRAIELIVEELKAEIKKLRQMDSFLS